jgi:hypothetical protein
MVSRVLAALGGLVLMLCVSGALADDLEDCRSAVAKRDLDLAIDVCSKAMVSAPTPQDVAVASTLLAYAQQSKDRAQLMPPTLDEPIIVAPESKDSALKGQGHFDTDPSFELHRSPWRADLGI